MTVGFVMLAHTALDRAFQVAQILAAEGCPVAIHVDKRTMSAEFDRLAEAVAREPNLSLAKRFRCEWGTWSLVKASRTAAEQLLSENPEIDHVMLISGACLPIKPVTDLKTFLAARNGVDFIESVTVQDAPWTQGGLSDERFNFSFPFAWKRHQWFFDIWVSIQRRIRRKRALPEGVVPHLGSQWWCLSRGTLERILDDTRRGEKDRYFRRAWIPDESYFQSMVRIFGTHIESRSLTFSRFDFQGKPYVLYDDHVNLLADSPAFFARKIWRGAKHLYKTFPLPEPGHGGAPQSIPGAFAHRVFGEAVSQRTTGRAGLAMAGRFPKEGFETGLTAGPYSVFHGFGEVFADFPGWIEGSTASRAHGNLFAPERCEFAGGETLWAGAMCDSAALRDYDAEGFLRNLVWNTRGERQSFLLSARDSLEIGSVLSRDRNASIFAITGAWILPLLHSGQSVEGIRAEAARLQQREELFVQRLKERRALSTSRVWTLAELLARPSEPLQYILDELRGEDSNTLSVLPEYRPLSGLPELLQALKNAGMDPFLAGELSGLPLPEQTVATTNVVRMR